ncbi:MAG: TIGR00282 family metallophosphoesterase [Spirochaetota bacterium]
MSIRILALGEIVGKPGIYTVKTALQQLKKEYNIDLVIANAEGATGGFGIGKNHSIYLRKVGVDVLTTGEKTFYKKDMVDHIAKAPYILRPANYPAKTPGRGWRTFEVGSRQVAVVNLLGQGEFPRIHLSNPFSLLPVLLEKIHEITPYVIVQYHAATTAERKAMFFYADGRVSAVIGTHSKVMTADAELFPKGTAVITDNGRCGSTMSVGGLEPELEIRKYLTQIPERSNECWDALELQGALLTLDDDGKAHDISTLQIPVKTPEKERQ